MSWLKNHWLKAIIFVLIAWVVLKWYYTSAVTNQLAGVSGS